MTTLNRMPIDIGLSERLELLKKEILLNFNSHHIATIQSFNAANQTARATINYKKEFYNRDPVTGVYSPTLINYPVLADCPVICLGGGTASLTFPITVGDECLVFFNDRDMDLWFHSGGGSTLNTSRLHSFADGIILVGLRNQTRVLQNYSTTHAVLQNGSAQVGIGASTINISNGVPYPSNGPRTSLLAILTNLITAIETAKYGTNSIDSTVALEAVKTAIGNLLE